jgi:hypothetical protein
LSEPLGYSSAALPLEPQGRPTVVTVLAIIGIVLGALGVLCKPMSLMMYFVPMPAGNPVMDRMKADQALFIWTMASTSVGWFLSIVLLVCGIGALALKEWSRQGLIGWSILTLVVDLAVMIFNWVWVMPRMNKILAGQPNPGGNIGMIAGIAVGVVFSVALPIVLIYFMTRPAVKAAFARGLRPIV